MLHSLAETTPDHWDLGAIESMKRTLYFTTASCGLREAIAYFDRVLARGGLGDMDHGLMLRLAPYAGTS